MVFEAKARLEAKRVDGRSSANPCTSNRIRLGSRDAN